MQLAHWLKLRSNPVPAVTMFGLLAWAGAVRPVSSRRDGYDKGSVYSRVDLLRAGS